MKAFFLDFLLGDVLQPLQLEKIVKPGGSKSFEQFAVSHLIVSIEQDLS